MKIFKTLAGIVFIWGLSLSIQSCGSSKTLPPKELELTGQWYLKTFEGDSVAASFKGTTPSILFDVIDKTISGVGGCNKYSGGYIIDKKGLFSAPTLVKTTMACFQDNKEDDFFKKLAIPSSLNVNSDGELIFVQNKTVVMIFSKHPTIVDDDLTGVWTLEKLADKSVSSMFSKIPTIEFKEERIQGKAGCNSYSGGYSLDTNTITIGALMMTKMACPSLDGERLFTTALQGVSKISIEKGKLIFKKEGKVILEFGK